MHRARAAMPYAQRLTTAFGASIRAITSEARRLLQHRAPRSGTPRPDLEPWPTQQRLLLLMRTQGAGSAGRHRSRHL